MKHWRIEQVAWDRFDPSKVDAEVVPLVKAAAMVERNGDDYALYLNAVFHADPDFQHAANHWAVEENQHGDALGRWATLADPAWDFAAAFARYRAGYTIDTRADASIRGSRTGELIARCMVETGTSSYYTALGESTEEPVLREVCRLIAADEYRHFKLFYDLCGFMARAMGYYRFRLIESVMGMIFKPVGLEPRGRLSDLSARGAWRLLQWRRDRYRAALLKAANENTGPGVTVAAA